MQRAIIRQTKILYIYYLYNVNYSKFNIRSTYEYTYTITYGWVEDTTEAQGVATLLVEKLPIVTSTYYEIKYHM